MYILKYMLIERSNFQKNVHGSNYTNQITMDRFNNTISQYLFHGDYSRSISVDVKGWKE